MTSDNDGQSWSCGTCTFLNKPLFLSCEMCGQARPSQRPSPPRRQPSLPASDSGNSGDGRRRSDRHSSEDRAPRSIQRHHSNQINITGTLIMTDDPADYETQDGKKPGEDEEEQQEQQQGLVSYERRREDDPTMDESMERHMLEPPRRRQSSHEEEEVSPQRLHQSSSSVIRRCNTAPHSHRARDRQFQSSRDREMSQYSSRGDRETHHQHQHQHQHQQHHAPPSTRKTFSGSGSALSGSTQTLPTAYMGSSSCRIEMEDSSYFADDVSSLSRSGGRSGRFHNSNSSGAMGSSGRRPMRTRSAAPSCVPEVDYPERQEQPFPRMTGATPARTASSTSSGRYPTRHQRRGSSNSGGLMMTDSSGNSQLSSCSSQDDDGGHCMRSPVATTRGPRRLSASGRGAASMRHIAASPASVPNNRNLRRGASVAHIPPPRTNSGDFVGSVLPSLDPPPVPTLDRPGDVDSMAVFNQDKQADIRRGKTADTVRKDRGKMLDNLSRSGAFSLNNSSNRSLGGGSSLSMATSSRRLQPSQRGLSTRPGDEGSAPMHPCEMMMREDDEALDSPNTRRERRKEKKRMKGAVRTLMATMRISSATK